MKNINPVFNAEKIQSRGTRFGIAGKLLLGVAVLGGLAYGVAESVRYIDRRDLAAIESNKCEWVEVVAEKDSHYRKWAVEAIKSSNDLGRKVGVERVENILREKNDNRYIVKGQTYEVLDCDCN